MKWTKEAEDLVSRVPFFVRKKVRHRVEEEAMRQGSREVTIHHVKTCQKRYMGSMEDEIKGYQVENCFGPTGCPNRAVSDEGITDRIEAILAGRNLKEFLKGKVNGPLKFHHELRVSVSDCPNACSRPQIADIGLIGASKPSVSGSPCTGCGACVSACREGAVRLDDDGPVIDFSKCVSCGKCISACPSGTLETAQQGWRILVGGKLGRHPQLGRELPGIHPSGRALSIIERCIEFYIMNNIEGERLGDVLNRVGFEAFEKSLKGLI